MRGDGIHLCPLVDGLGRERTLGGRAGGALTALPLPAGGAGHRSYRFLRSRAHDVLPRALQLGEPDRRLLRRLAELPPSGGSGAAATLIASSPESLAIYQAEFWLVIWL